VTTRQGTQNSPQKLQDTGILVFEDLKESAMSINSAYTGLLNFKTCLL
jgi:hypothetical protein